MQGPIIRVKGIRYAVAWSVPGAILGLFLGLVAPRAAAQGCPFYDNNSGVEVFLGCRASGCRPPLVCEYTQCEGCGPGPGIADTCLLPQYCDTFVSCNFC